MTGHIFLMITSNKPRKSISDKKLSLKNSKLQTNVKATTSEVVIEMMKTEDKMVIR